MIAFDSRVMRSVHKRKKQTIAYTRRSLFRALDAYDERVQLIDQLDHEIYRLKQTIERDQDVIATCADDREALIRTILILSTK